MCTTIEDGSVWFSLTFSQSDTVLFNYNIVNADINIIVPVSILDKLIEDFFRLAALICGYLRVTSVLKLKEMHDVVIVAFNFQVLF